MSNPKAQFQINNGNGWETIAEADIIDGVAQIPVEWAMIRAMEKRVSYTGYTQEKIIVSPGPRDTHFSAYAAAQLDELVHTYFEDIPMMDRFWEETKKKIELILARRAYDLVKYTILNIGPADLDMLTNEECVQRVPDLPELPEVEE